jgi:hypothetical protein
MHVVGGGWGGVRAKRNRTKRSTTSSSFNRHESRHRERNLQDRRPGWG